MPADNVRRSRASAYPLSPSLCPVFLGKWLVVVPLMGLFSPPLGADPQQWTETHVRDWVMWAVNEFSLKGVDFQKFCMNGAALCALGKECFLELAPDFVGDILWEHLEILQKGECWGLTPPFLAWFWVYPKTVALQ